VTPAVAAFPWDTVMRVGFGVLRLAPAAFWAMTPREITRALEALYGAGHPAPNRGDLTRLMAAFPDTGNPPDEADRS